VTEKTHIPALKDPRAARAELQDRQAQPRPGLAMLLDRAAEQIRPAGPAPELENEVKL